MHKLYLFLLIFLGIYRLDAQISVLVSIAPQKFLVKKIGGEEVAVEVIVPTDADSHSYEPTAKQLMSLQKAEIWFRLGESFENRMLGSSRKIHIVNQQEGLDLINMGCGCCNGPHAHDPHIWLSPKILKQMAAQMTAILSQHDPAHGLYFAANFSLLEKELDSLELACAAQLASCRGKTILVSHPAFGYFCKDFGLVQLSIESEGKEPTPKYLTDLIFKAKKLHIKTVFLQKQHNPKGGEIIAKELRATTCYIDPYHEDVIENLSSISKLFADALS